MKYNFGKSITLVLLASLFLIGITRPAFAAPSSASSRALKPFRVEEFQKVLLPDTTNSAVGQRVRLNTDGSEVLRLNLGYRFIARMSAGFGATVGGMPQTARRGELFTRRKVSGGRLSELATNALILCREPVQHNFGQAMAAALTLGLTQAGANYAENVQLCAVDEDRDGAVEKLFLGGAKRQQDLEFTSIVPVPYEYRENFPVEGIRFVLYATTGLFGGDPLLMAGVERNGQRTHIDVLRFETNGVLVNEKAVVPIKKGKLPREIRFGSAVILLRSYDANTGIIEAEFVKYFDTQVLDWSFSPNTIYISY